jgi:hypothetical protein
VRETTVRGVYLAGVGYRANELNYTEALTSVVSFQPHWLKTDFSRFRDSDESDADEQDSGDFANVS